MSKNPDFAVFIAKLVMILVPVCFALAVLGGIAKGVAYITNLSSTIGGDHP